MDASTLNHLSSIKQHLNSRSRKDNGFGKTCQIFLAITFCRLGFQVENYSSQGVDIDSWNHSYFPNISIEVKTTTKHTVTLGQKDVDGLKKKAREGYEPIFAVLRLELLSSWIIAKAKGIKAGNHPLGRLQTSVRAMPELQDQVNQIFSRVVNDYGAIVSSIPAEEVLTYLDKCLDREKLKVLPKGSVMGLPAGHRFQG
ncbi:hypothetical protein [Moorena bouillonii]|uniref:Uncharacterized protein n=1 Tax=Moorena bouillonii PNG TaxID=568701 RepID=A0A1U7MWI2_9CYAN|nr:hypothetical protein [Moorena bouillonii]OLT58014.1 hypothetical protein BJP37_02130 [Moorena bouillonii PNG]